MPSLPTSRTAWLPTRNAGESGAQYLERVFARRIGAIEAAADLDMQTGNDSIEDDRDPYANLWRDPAAFRDVLLIDTDDGPRVLGQAMDDWQRDDYAALDPAWQSLIGIRPGTTATIPRNAWLERPKGHSKTTDIAVQVAWILSASPRIIWGLCAANDKDQAGLIRKALVKLKADNPWLPLLIRNWQIINPDVGSTLDIIAADVAGSHGQLPDFVVCDEVTHWQSFELYESLRAGSAKRRNALFLVITNAGEGRGWQWRMRELARTRPQSWYFRTLDGPQASWLSAQKLDEQRDELTPATYRRLWLNEWQTGTGDGISEQDLIACCTLPGPLREPRSGWVYLLGVDLGLRSDHAAAVLLGVKPNVGGSHETGFLDAPEFEVARVLDWKPADYGGEIPLDVVEREVSALADKFRVATIYGDESQFALMKRRLETRWHTVSVPFGSAKIQRGLGPALLKAFRHRHVRTYPLESLEYDLRAITVIENPQTRTWKVEAPADAEHGHADRGIALALVLLFGYSWIETPAVSEYAESEIEIVSA